MDSAARRQQFPFRARFPRGLTSGLTSAQHAGRCLGIPGTHSGGTPGA